MKKWLQKLVSRTSLPFFFSMSFFFIMLATILFLGPIIYVLIRWNLIPLHQGSGVLLFILWIGIASIICGSIMAICFSDIPLRPFRKTIEALEQLANGNFNTCLDIDYPKEFRELSDSFNRMARELNNTEILRKDFIDNFSHEFKTPIISIKGFAKLLEDPHLTEMQRQEYLTIIQKEASRLADLSTNVLHVTKLENQEIINKNDCFNVSEQIRKVVILLQNKWEEKEIELDLDLEDVDICADEALLQQVWINLLDNAIKFTPTHGCVHVMLINSADFVTCIIKDTGIGMMEEQMKHIFIKFYQADTSHKMEGNGLGLSVVKKIVELHKGSILVESKKGKGSTFTVCLPKQ